MRVYSRILEIWSIDGWTPNGDSEAIICSLVISIFLSLDMRSHPFRRNLDEHNPATRSMPTCAAIDGIRLPLQKRTSENNIPTMNVVVIPRFPWYRCAMANQAEDKIPAIAIENEGFTNMRLNTANTNPRYRNSSDRPAVHASAVNMTDSLIVRGMIFSVSRNKNPRCASGTFAIIRRPA